MLELTDPKQQDAARLQLITAYLQVRHQEGLARLTVYEKELATWQTKKHGAITAIVAAGLVFAKVFR